jgi:RND family efflux transporter MFP subunit
MTRRVLMLGVVVLGGTAACSRSGAVEAERPAVPVEVAEVRKADLAEAVEVVGSLAPKLSAELKSEYSGTVAEVLVREWVAVRAGQPLARLDSRESEAGLEAAKAALLQAEVAETRAARELARAHDLKQVGLTTQQGLDDARTACDAATAATAAARAQLRAAETRLAKAVIRAPFDGVVAFRGVSVGDRVESMGSGPAMFQVVDDRVLELTMVVPSLRLAAVRVGQAVEFTVDALAGRAFAGKVMFINPSVDAASRAGKVMADVENRDGRLKGGLFAKGRILVGTRAGVVQVPRAALQSWDVEAGAADVFVIRGDTAERRRVRTGSLSGEVVEVAEGLAPGERVATRGAFNLRPGMRVKAVPAQGA